MKRVSLYLVFVATVIILAQFTLRVRAATQENISGYISVVQQASEESWGTGYGALYDVDGNGVEELIVLYTVGMENDDGGIYPVKVCSVYTMDNGKVLQLIDKEKLFIEAGGPSGYAAVVKNDGSTYLAITHENGETAGEYVNRGGEWNLYTINGATVELTTNVEYDYFRENEILYDKSSATINGQTCSFKEYENWKKELKEVLKVDANGLGDEMSLKELLEYLEATPASKTDNIVHSGTCGENAKWTLDNEGTLIISGKGTIIGGVYDDSNHFYYYSSQIKNVIINSGITRVRFDTFMGCTEINTINIPDTVFDLEDNPFSDCTSLQNINVSKNNQYYCVENDSLFDKNKETLICRPCKSKNRPVLEGVTTLGTGCFAWCTDLTQIELPSTLTTIESSAFWGCTGLTNVTIPEGVTTIGGDAFANCTALSGIELPESLVSLGSNVFKNCSSLTDIIIPENVSEIGIAPFVYCKQLTNLQVSPNNSMFSASKNILYNKEKTRIYSCHNASGSLVIPEGITGIDQYAFMGCDSLVSVSLPSTVLHLAWNQFWGCTALESIFLPRNINQDKIGPFILNHPPKEYRDSIYANNIILSDIYYEGTIEEFIGGEIPEEYSYYANASAVSHIDSPTIHFNYRSPYTSFSTKTSAWSFINDSVSFAKDPISNADDYYIPEERYDEVFGSAFVDATLIFDEEWSGSCAGMSTTAILYYLDLLEWDEYVSSVGMEDEWPTVNSYCQDYLLYNNNANQGYPTSGYNTDITRLIEAYQLYINSFNRDNIIRELSGTYYESKYQEEKTIFSTKYVRKHLSKSEGGTYITSMLEKFQKAYEDNIPLYISLKYRESGHAIVSRTDRKPEDMGDGWWRIYVYDPNKPYIGSTVNLDNDDEGFLYGCNDLIDNGDDVFLELNPEMNIWRYCIEVESNSNKDYIGADLLDKVIYQKWTFTDDDKTYKAESPEYFFTIDVSQISPTDYAYPSFEDTSSWLPENECSIHIDSNTNMDIYDETGQLVARIINGYPVILTEEGTAVNYAGAVNNTTDGQFTLQDMGYSIDYISGKVTFLGNDNAISFSADAEMRLDVDLLENSVQVISGDTGTITVKCANVLSVDECSFVETSGTLATDETFEFAYSDENKVIAETNSKEGTFTLYQKDSGQAEAIKTDTISSNNSLWLWIIVGASVVVITSASITTIIVVKHKKSKK